MTEHLLPCCVSSQHFRNTKQLRHVYSEVLKYALINSIFALQEDMHVVLLRVKYNSQKSEYNVFWLLENDLGNCFQNRKETTILFQKLENLLEKLVLHEKQTKKHNKKKKRKRNPQIELQNKPTANRTVAWRF